MKENIFMFDVEATSLHGVGFAVGAVVANKKTGAVHHSFSLMCTEGIDMASDWVKENVIPNLTDIPVCQSLHELRERFYEFYIANKDTCDVWSDCNFPVETNFLSAVVAASPKEREWQMPYPLYDLATVLDVSISRDDLSRNSNLRKHNPLHDSIASLHCLLMAPSILTPGR